ncbi:MAG: hypothetical protein COY40_05165 [Alphaproteobacteria bacterium CG_4_10_14_0_8_um_filter_53_9]|nr:MAG: hypothetical protein COY40_05165 [Alphaproteobacteria bacterium CG_4_10_14_0_8_um_filter_53_9]
MVTPKQASRVDVRICYAHPETGELWEKRVMAPGHQNVAWAVNASGMAGVFAAWREECVLSSQGRRVKGEAPLEDGMLIFVGVKADKAMVAEFREHLRG